MSDNRPVGFFDSGVGGTCILKAFQELCPNERTIYLADTEHCPYGNRPAEEIIRLSEANVRKLLDQDCKMIVVACNTATAAAIDYLRATYPEIPFIGLEPAVKPAAHHSKTGVVAVLATAGTFNGRLYKETKERFAKDVTVIAAVADEFVTLVEAMGRGEVALTDESARQIVETKIRPLVAAGADHLVLGCTHFPHLKTLIEEIAGPSVSVIDPSPAVAAQARRVLEARDLLAQEDLPKDDESIPVELPPRADVSLLRKCVLGIHEFVASLASRWSTGVFECSRFISPRADRKPKPPSARRCESARCLPDLEAAEERVEESVADAAICMSAPSGIAEEILKETTPKPPNLHAANLSFSARLLTYVKEKCGGVATVAYKRAGVSRQIYSRIIARDDAKVDKRTALQFCIGLQLEMREAELLLKSAGYAFSNTLPEDRVFSYCIENRIWNLLDIDQILQACKLRPLVLDRSVYK